MNTFGENVRARRLELGITQKELADRLGVHYQQVGRQEKTNISPSIHRARDYAEALDCSAYIMTCAFEGFATAFQKGKNKSVVLLDKPRKRRSLNKP